MIHVVSRTLNVFIRIVVVVVKGAVSNEGHSWTEQPSRLNKANTR